MENNVRVVIGIILFIIMIGVGIFVITNIDTIFNQEVKIIYPDKCVEKYVNNNLITPECTKGRQLAEDQLNGKKIYNDDLNFQMSPLDIKLNGTI